MQSTRLLAPPAELTRATGAGARYLNWQRRLKPYALLLPLLLWWALIIGYPLVRAVVISLTNSSPLNGQNRFVGFQNFVAVFSGGATTEAVTFTIVFALASTVLQMLFGATVAVLLSRLRRFRWLRGIVLIPWGISEIVVATAGTWMFNARYGLVDAIFHALAGIRPEWLSNVTLARLALIIMNSWEYFPLVSLFILTALLNVDRGLVEQAQVDGASKVATYRHVVWYLVQPVVMGIGTFVTAINVVAFALPYAMTGGAPGTSTLLVSYQVYQLAIPGLEYGAGAALGVVVLAIVLVIGAVGGLLVRRAQRRVA